MSTSPWILVGAGRMGRFLGQLAVHLDLPIRCAFNRTVAGSQTARRAFCADHYLFGELHLLAPHLQEPGLVLWLTPRDADLPATARALAALLREHHAPAPRAVLHCTGSQSSNVLRLAGFSNPVASLHPLLAITEATDAITAAGSARWTVEGDDEAVAYACWLMARLHVEPARIAPEAKILYHCAAVVAANLLVALEDAAFQIAAAAGLPPDQARDMLLPLAHSALQNLETLPPAQALSGPAARDDLDTIERHRRALAGLEDKSLAQLYEVLTARALALSRRGEGG